MTAGAAKPGFPAALAAPPLIALAIVFGTLPMWMDDYWIRVWTGVAMWAGLAASWNIIGGYAGYISFGHVAFFGIGAYATAILMQPGLDWNFFLTLPVGAVVAALFALIVGWPRRWRRSRRRSISPAAPSGSRRPAIQAPGSSTTRC